MRSIEFCTASAVFSWLAELARAIEALLARQRLGEDLAAVDLGLLEHQLAGASDVASMVRSRGLPAAVRRHEAT